MTDIPKVAIDTAAKATREEIVRQYREDERGKCPAGANFYEEEVSPALIAEAALTAAAPFLRADLEKENRLMNDTIAKCAIDILNLTNAGTFADGIGAAAQMAARHSSDSIMIAAIRALKPEQKP